MFIVTAPQMKKKPITLSQSWLPFSELPQSASSAAMVVAVNVPPSQMGLLNQ